MASWQVMNGKCEFFAAPTTCDAAGARVTVDMIHFMLDNVEWAQ